VADQPNIVVFWGDDIGISNLSCYSDGLMGWAEPFVATRVPYLFNLRTDPFERADITSNTYWDWFLDRAFLLVPAQAIIGDFLQTFMEFPPRQKAASFTIDQVQAKLEAAIASGH